MLKTRYINEFFRTDPNMLFEMSFQLPYSCKIGRGEA